MTEDDTFAALKYRREVDADGAVCYYNHSGQRHREDGPASIWADGSQHWYLNNIRHRKGGPAIIWADGSKEWWVNGERHRKGGPAIIDADGSKEWWVNGEFFK